MDVSIVIFFFGAVESFCVHDKKNLSSYISATTDSSTPFKVTSSVKEYYQNASMPLEKIKDLLQNGITIPEDFSIPSKSTAVNKSSKISKASFKGGEITHVEILDDFNFDGSEAIPVRISTTWSQQNSAKSINDHASEKLAQSVIDGNILNVTMSLEWKTEHKELDKDKSTKSSPRTETVEIFSKIWKRSRIPEVTNGQISVATNNPCGVVTKGLIKRACQNDSWPKITYVHPLDKFLSFEKQWYQFDTKPTAIGITSNISYEFNRTGNTCFINFTVLFSNWTFDFPNGFLYNYRDQSFENENTVLEIFYWTEEVVKQSLKAECPLPTYSLTTTEHPTAERPIPPSFFIMAYIMIVPTAVLVLSLLLRLLTCSKHAFNLNVWQFKDENIDVEAEEKHKKNKNVDVEEIFSAFEKKSQRISKEKYEERARDMVSKDGFELNHMGREKQI